MGIDGILNIFKPKGMSSFRVVYEIKKILKVKKIGHTGTLDPNASGILLICLGQATKIARFITDFKKYYQGEMVLGITTDSQDSEGKITGKKDISGSIDREKIKNVFYSCIDLKVVVLEFGGKIPEACQRFPSCLPDPGQFIKNETIEMMLSICLHVALVGRMLIIIQ